MAVASDRERFLDMLEERLRRWRAQGLPPRWSLLQELQELVALRSSLGVRHPLGRFLHLLTATLDDGWGMGIDMIHHACGVLGLSYRFVGLAKTPEEVVLHCRGERPDVVALTVLLDDTVAMVKHLRAILPGSIPLFVGGPASEAVRHEEVEGVVVLRDLLAFFEVMKNFSV